MRVYISGKMTGLRKSEVEFKFTLAETYLRANGYDVVNPARMSDFNLSYAEFMLIDTTLVTMCDAIYMLNNWRDSNGAKEELALAEAKGLKIMYEVERCQQTKNT